MSAFARVSIGKICAILNGFAFQSEKYVDKGIRIIRIANVQKGRIDDSSPKYYPYSSMAEILSFMLSDGDLLMSLTGNVGRVAIINADMLPAALNQRVACLRLYDNAPVTMKYLYSYLNSNRFEEDCIRSSKGVAQKNMSTEWLKEYEIPLIPMIDQDRLTSKLDSASEVLRLRKAQLAELDKLVKSQFIEMFGDPVTNPYGYTVSTLQELIDTEYITYHLDGNHGGDYPRSEEFVASGVPYIGANCISGGRVSFVLAKHLTSEQAGKLRKGIAQNGDVLFAHNATVGPVAILETDEPKVILSTSLTAYRCNQDKLKPSYLKAYMQTDAFIRQYAAEMKQTTRNQVPITAQKKYLFLVPPLDLQRQYVSLVDQVDESRLVIQQALDEAQRLFDSLMAEYFEA